LSKGIPDSVIQQTVANALEKVEEAESAAPPAKKTPKPKPEKALKKAAKKVAKAPKSADVRPLFKPGHSSL